VSRAEQPLIRFARRHPARLARHPARPVLMLLEPASMTADQAVLSSSPSDFTLISMVGESGERQTAALCKRARLEVRKFSPVTQSS
jgi:hypothetical protein